MTAILSKIKDKFSDLWLDIELMFSKKSASKEVRTEVEKIVAPASSAPVVPGVMPVNPSAPESTDGATKIYDMQAKKAAEKQERIKNTKLPFALRNLRLSHKARLYFYDQMATLVGSGVPLIDAISLIQAQERNKNVKKLYGEMIRSINAGLSLAESMEMFPKIFPQMQSALVEAAEASGNMKEVLAELVEEMEASQDFLKKITGAMVYPIILLLMAVGLVTAMMIFVIPKIAGMYEQASVELPALTQFVINLSNFTTANGKVLALAVVFGAIALYYFFAKLRIGRLLGEKIISSIPVAGRINKEKNIMMICSNMAMLMKSGVLITEAFAITQKTIGNLHYQKALEEVRQGVVMGREVSQMMGLEDIRAQKFKEHKLFPLQMAQLIHIGETTGNIANMLYKIKNNYRKSIDHTLKNISTLIEPLMIFIVAALVGSILMAVMLPFFYIGSTIS